MTSAAHVRLTQADIDEARHEELIEDEYGYSLSKCAAVNGFTFSLLLFSLLVHSLSLSQFWSVCLV